MANSFTLQHTNSPPLTPFLRKRNVGLDNVRFCQTRINDHGGSAGLSLQIRRRSVIAPSLKIRAQHASGDNLSWKPSNANEVKLADHLFWRMAKYNFQRYQIIVMDKWLSSLSLKDNPFSNEARDDRKNKIEEFWKLGYEMSKSISNPKDKLTDIYDGISKVFERNQLECTNDKVNDITFAIMLQDFRGTYILLRIKEMGELLSTMAHKGTRLLHTDQPCLLVEYFKTSGAGLTDLVKRSISDLPIFVEFSAERQEFMDSLNLRRPTHDQVQLGAYDLLDQIICTMREVNTLLLRLDHEIQPYMDDGYLPFSSKKDTIVMLDQLKYCCKNITPAEKDFKDIETAMRHSRRRLNYDEASLQKYVKPFEKCISGYNEAIEGFTTFIKLAVD